MLSAAALVAAVAALFTGLLLLGENATLPAYDVVVREQQTMASRGYDLVPLEAPRLAGVPLRLLAFVSRTKVIGRILNKQLYRDNHMLEVRRLAAYVPDQPLYYPYVDSHTSLPPPDAPLVLTQFSQKNVNAKTTASEGGFKHWTISDYTSRYTSGELSPVQVAKAFLAAVKDSEARDLPLKIFVEKHDDDILAQAKASALRYKQGKPLGVLDGVPVAIKDEMDIKGYKMSVGTSFLGDAYGVASSDSLPVARLRAAGAIITGKTNMHEIGVGITGFNINFGTTRNPYNPTHYTGGSSSGSSVAVASGIVPLAVGLDGGGSIRIPAGLCGVVGIKPTFMRVPPLSPDCPSVSHIGPIAGNVRDAAIGYAVLSGGDEVFPRSVTQPQVDLRSFESTQSLKGLKIGYFPRFVNDSDPQIASAVHTAIHKLQTLGAELVEVKLDFLRAIHLAHSSTIVSEMAQNLDKFYSEFHKISPEAQLLLIFGREYSSLDFMAAQRVRAFALRQLQEQVFSKVDVFVSPTTGITAPKIPDDALSFGELNAVNLGHIMRFSVYGNFVGNPGVAVPIGYDTKGMPISLQVQSNHWDEDVMLRFAHATEKLYAHDQKQPQVYYSILDDAAKL